MRKAGYILAIVLLCAALSAQDAGGMPSDLEHVLIHAPAANLTIVEVRITDIYDGDSFTADIHLGMGVVLEGRSVRLADIDAPEVRGSERGDGLQSRDALIKYLHRKHTVLLIREQSDKYGRIVGVLFADEENINDWMFRNGHATLYGKFKN